MGVPLRKALLCWVFVWAPDFFDGNSKYDAHGETATALTDLQLQS